MTLGPAGLTARSTLFVRHPTPFADLRATLRRLPAILPVEVIQSMKRSLALLTLAASLALAADKPNLNGNWKIDPKKSEFGEMPAPESFTRKIVQSGPAVTFTDEQSSPLGQEKVDRKYTTDGKEITYEWGGSEIKSAAHWEGDALIIVGKLNASGTDLIVTSTITLSADGTTITEADKIAMAGNDVAAFKLVLVKQ